MNGLNDKIELLRRRFHEVESAVVAFSGGVDSAVLVAIAHQELGDKMLAATAASPSFPKSDKALASSFCAVRDIPHKFIETGEFEDPSFLKNPDDRCYLCKRHLYDALIACADEARLQYIVEGTNASDLAGHRPGFRASRENPRVVTPLIDCGFTKEDVRALARTLKLEVAEKPSAACLSSRIPTGEILSKEIMRRIDRAEDVIRGIGAGQVRVRHHGDLTRIEVDPSDMMLCLEHRNEIHAKIKDLGWKFVTLDILGYRTGGGKE